LCREDAAEIAALKPQLDELNIKLVGIVHEAFGTDEFRQFWKHELYLDDTRSFFLRILGGHWATLSELLSSAVRAASARAKAKGFSGNWKGEGKLKGGLIVVGEENRGIVYEFREETLGTHADPKTVLEVAQKLAAARGVDSKIIEKTTLETKDKLSEPKKARMVCEEDVCTMDHRPAKKVTAAAAEEKTNPNSESHDAQPQSQPSGEALPSPTPTPESTQRTIAVSDVAVVEDVKAQ